ncbi:MAG TPA: hypothetical protein PKD28_02805 [Candidatus Saccharibacteria bacterium]|nr:hypothetical protein [Candidatus Saccharibacteria bacterium]
MKKDDVTLRKRAQVSKANRTMFFWVAGMSVIVGFSAVASIFLFQRVMFNAGIIREKQNTASTLKENISALDSLKKDIAALNSNAILRDLRAHPDDSALQVVLDALPSQANSLALGASIQDRLLKDLDIEIDNLTLDEGGDDSLGFDTSSTDGAAEEGDTGSEAATPNTNTVMSIPFTLSVRAQSPNVLRELLTRLERSIRTINVRSLKIEQQGDEIQLTIEAVAYYQLEKVMETRKESRSMSSDEKN